MEQYNILNLYACLGGNRYKWDEVLQQAGITNYKITAVELDPELARLYQERFPNDIVIVSDAHQYLLDHYKEFDFIWTSPPCPSQSRARYWNASNYDTTTEPIYPDMTLYQEILFLKHWYKTGKFVVENVIPYYEPLIQPQIRDRHLYWSNIKLPQILSERYDVAKERKRDELKNLCDFHDYNFRKYKGKQPIIKIARNIVDYEAGKTILATALNIQLKSKNNQLEIF